MPKLLACLVTSAWCQRSRKDSRDPAGQSVPHWEEALFILKRGRERWLRTLTAYREILAQSDPWPSVKKRRKSKSKLSKIPVMMIKKTSLDEKGVAEKYNLTARVYS